MVEGIVHVHVHVQVDTNVYSRYYNVYSMCILIDKLNRLTDYTCIHVTKDTQTNKQR